MANKRTHNNAVTDDGKCFEVLTHSTPTYQSKKPKSMMLEVTPLTVGSSLPIIVSVASTSTSDVLKSDKILPSTSRDAAYNTKDIHIKREVHSEELHEDLHADIDFEETYIKDEIVGAHEIEDTDDLGYQYIVSSDAKLDVSKEQNIKKEAEACVEILDSDEDSDHKDLILGDSSDTTNKTTSEQNRSRPPTPKPQKKYLVPIPTSPIEIFRMFINDQLLNLIVHETNKNGTKRNDWNATDNDEILRFIGLLLHTGTISMHRLADYWSLHYLYDLRVFGRFMTRSRFLQILDFLRFSDESDKEKIEAIHPLINIFNGVMKRIYCPGRNLIIDKIASFHCGNLVTKEFNNMRNMRILSSRLYTIYALVESESGIIWKLAVVNGMPDVNKVVEYLLRNNLNQGHTVYITEHCMNLDIPHQLLLKGTYSTGPISTQLRDATFRKYMKDQEEEAILHTSLRKKGLNVYIFNNEYYLSSETNRDDEQCTTAPRRPAALLKPRPLLHYEQAMHTDYNTTAMTYYPCRDITLPWTKKVFIHVLQVALLNSYKLSNFARFVPFRTALLESFLPPEDGVLHGEKHSLTVISTKKMRMRRTKTGEISQTLEVIRKVCRGCKTRSGQRPKHTIYECPQCPGAPGFCSNCFERVHINMEYTMDGVESFDATASDDPNSEKKVTTESNLSSHE